MKKIIINFITIMFISLPIIVFCIYFCTTFWGVIVELNVNKTNIDAIKDALSKDNIKVENLNDVYKIEISGAGLNDYSHITFYSNKDTNKQVVYLYNNEYYHIEEYIYDNTFNCNDVFSISIFISLLAIFIFLYIKMRKYISLKLKNNQQKITD